jgi:hypothetical protein
MSSGLLIFIPVVVMLAIGSILAISPRAYGDIFHRHPRQRSHFEKWFRAKHGPRDMRIFGALITTFSLTMIVLLVRDYMRN